MNMKNHSKASNDDEYTCPMHHDVKGKKGDACPKCKMKLSKNKV
jgi:hypothetical protein